MVKSCYVNGTLGLLMILYMVQTASHQSRDNLTALSVGIQGAKEITSSSLVLIVSPVMGQVA